MKEKPLKSRLVFKIRLLNQWAAHYWPFVRMNHILFWWYYRRVPEFYRQWTILKSVSVLSASLRQLEREWQYEAKRADDYFVKVVEFEVAQLCYDRCIELLSKK